MSQTGVLIKNCCRVCLDTDLSQSVYLEPGNDLLEKYEYCSGLTIHENDEPRHLCITCSELMKEFADFKKKCHDSHHHWKNIAKDINEKCYLEDNKVKEEFGESIVKEEIFETENVFSQSDEIVRQLNSIGDGFEDPFHYEYDETTAYDPGPRNVKTSKRINVKGFNKRKPKIKKNSKVTEVKSNIHHCGLCDFKSCIVEKIKEHLKDHSVKNELTCKFCNYEGDDFADMVIHRYDHCPEGVRIFCHQCNKRFYCVKRLQFHYRSDHLNKPGGRCVECNLNFERYQPFRNHHLLRHDDNVIDKYICDHCGKAFLYRHQIIEHLVDVADEKKFVCDLCGSASKRLSNLKLHMNTVHVNDAVKCDHCAMTFKNKFRLDCHLKMVAKKKQFICKLCSKAFYKPASLKKHEFWHTDERPFHCDICDKSFKNKQGLQTHLDRHRGIRRHKCKDCPKDFVTRSQLRVHSAVHTGIRRHKCTDCERSFNHKQLLVAHCRTKHNKESVKYRK